MATLKITRKGYGLEGTLDGNPFRNVSQASGGCDVWYTREDGKISPVTGMAEGEELADVRNMVVHEGTLYQLPTNADISCHGEPLENAIILLDRKCCTTSSVYPYYQKMMDAAGSIAEIKRRVVFDGGPGHGVPTGPWQVISNTGMKLATSYHRAEVENPQRAV